MVKKTIGKEIWLVARKKKNGTKPQQAEQPTVTAEETTSQEAVSDVQEVQETTADTVEGTVVPSEMETLRQELAAQKDQFLRMAAEYDNYRKRTEKEKLSTYDNAVAAAVEAFLPVVDNFALALDAGQNMPEEFRKGLEMIAKKFDGAFEKLHVKSFGERGEAFDPAFHNAISRADDPEIGEDHIVTVFQKGYQIGDKIIRHAMVQIAN